MSGTTRNLLLGCFILAAACARAGADGGSIMLSQNTQGYQITVFAAPTPFRAGPVDLSILVQDAKTGEVIPQVQVGVSLSRSGTAPLKYTASHEAATNKLLQAVQFTLPQPGHWDLSVTIDDSSKSVSVGGDIDAAEPLPPWRQLWPWLSWPALVIALFSMHQYLVRRRSSGGGSSDPGRT